ncbi:MAG TPA: glycosyltransferase family 2 protein [Terriglobia bacterium]|nr:glycosyltransferase family 2 protein [Terriglobia bacterium]
MSHNDVWNYSSQTVEEMVANAGSDVMVIGDSRLQIDPANGMYERMTQIVRDSGAGLVYSDSAGHPRIEYQLGSIRDNFDLGAVLAISVPAAREAVKESGNYQWGGLYDLRLRLSEKRPIIRIPEPLFASSIEEERPSAETQFDYVDPRNRDYQIEMERIATRHLQRIGAVLPPGFRKAERSADSFVVEASIVIPVRNRERTILEAVWSALSQKPGFDFNVIVVDNRSTDQTTEILRKIEDPRLIHIVPERTDLGIGGCWNLAVQSPACGRYVVQLDSDDLYSSDTCLGRIVEELRRGPYAMVVGSYSMVNFDMQPLPPGLIDHREWTDDNGPNNALRINGLGAPRAFDTAILRRIGFPNVSYGEDYAVGLRISRQYAIGRIYESVYLCRRWEGNSDSALPLETANRYDFYKDWLRTNEIRARQRR